MAARTNPYLAIPLSLLVALLLSALPLPQWLAYWRPPFVMLWLLFWVLRTPNLVGVWMGFWVGIFLDVLYAMPFGVNPFVLAVLAYLARLSYRWVKVFRVPQMAGLVAVMMLAALLLQQILLGFAGRSGGGWLIVLPALTSALIWPSLWLGLRRYVGQ